MPAKVCKPDTGSCGAAEMAPARSTVQAKTPVLNRFIRISLEVWTFQRESVARRSRANLSRVMSGPKPGPQRKKFSVSRKTRCLLPRRRQVHRRWRQKFHSRSCGFRLDACELALCAAASGNRREILVVEVLSQLLEIGLQRDRRAGAEIKGFAAGVLRQLVQIILRVVHQKEGPSAVAGAWVIHRPNIRILPLSALNQGVKVWAEWPEAGSTEIIDAGRDD